MRDYLPVYSVVTGRLLYAAYILGETTYLYKL
jgi:hypothetical protein